MKKALITGITGQDGSYLAEFLLAKGYEVHGIKRRASSLNTQRIDHLYEDPHASDTRFKLHYGDLTDTSNLTRLIRDIEPDEIYNLGAQSHVAVSFDTPEYTADVDAIGTLRILEAIRFYVSFACSFAFAERKVMEGNAKIIKLIARDEALHLTGTQHMINLMRDGKDDPDMKKIAKECESEVIQMFKDAAKQEKEWAEYLFRDGSMIGLNAEILKQYLEYITNVRMSALNIKPIFKQSTNPLPWMNHWLDNDNVQVAPQETEITSYLVSAIDNTMSSEDEDFSDFKL